MSDSKSPLDGKIARQVKDLPKSGIRDFFELVIGMDDVISLGVGEPDFVTPWHIREAAIFSLEKGHTSYTSNLGLLSLRKEVTKMVARDFGMQYNPNNECLISVGVSEALDLAFRALLNPGDEVIYHEPCFVSYAPGISLCHGVPVPVMTYEEDGFALDPARLEAAITPKTKAILLNFPCNPTGANLTLDQKQAIADLAIKHDLIVLADEIYSELTYGDRDVSIAALPGMQERTLFLHGVSKAYAMTGFRIGFACGPALLIDAMMKVHQYGIMCAPITAQEAALEALKHGEKQMLLMKDEYEQRRNLMVSRLNAMGIDCLEPKGAFYVFPNVARFGMSSTEFAKRLLMEERVAAVPGSAFTNDPIGANYLRCSYATGMADLKEALVRIERFISKL